MHIHVHSPMGLFVLGLVSLRKSEIGSLNLKVSENKFAFLY